ncbi:MAG: FAD:protein FMN transferase [Acidobacteria bacterium]|nr:FAD:protein FMN transferase [Acidobacteriota bacterium]MCA1611434.1 FAD:protein FMN transferase [Acidobacteriota bacterium]
MRLSLCLGGAVLATAAALPPRAASAGRARPSVRRVQYRMGTVLEIDAAGPLPASSLEAAVERAFAAVGRVESRLSNWSPASELSRANRAAGRSPFTLSPETWGSLSAAFALAEETGGAFDPTVGAITISKLVSTPADRNQDPAAAVLASIGYRHARFDPERGTLAFDSAETAIDSGAFGKGEGLDAAAAALRAGGVESARLNFGGQILVFGSATPAGRTGGYGRVAVAAPDASGCVVSRVEIPDGSLSTSGDAEQPGHLIDPRTGRAASFHGSASVFAAAGLRADALSTALFVMGPDAGLAFADARSIAAFFVEASGARRASRAWRRLGSWAETPPAAADRGNS